MEETDLGKGDSDTSQANRCPLTTCLSTYRTEAEKPRGCLRETLSLRWTRKTSQTELALHSTLLCVNEARIRTVHHWQCSQAGLWWIHKIQLGLFFNFLKEGWEIKKKKKRKRKKEKTTCYKALLNKHSGNSLSRKLNLSFSKRYIFPILPVLCGMIHSLYKEVMKPRKRFKPEKTQCTILWIQTFGIDSNVQCIEFLPSLAPTSINSALQSSCNSML